MNQVEMISKMSDRLLLSQIESHMKAKLDEKGMKFLSALQAEKAKRKL